MFMLMTIPSGFAMRAMNPPIIAPIIPESKPFVKYGNHFFMSVPPRQNAVLAFVPL